MGKWVEQGFVATDLQTYVDRLEAAFRTAYGNDFDVDPATPMGILIQAIAEMLYNTDVDGIEAYSRLNLNSMSGIYLDLVGAMRGVKRSLGEPQTAFVTITSNPSNFTAYTIPAGTVFTVIGTSDNFVTTAPETINSTTATISLQYSESGNSSAAVDNKMQVTGFSQIRDIVISSLIDGTERETDLDYRRRLQTEYPAANNTIEFVRNKLAGNGKVRVTGANYNDQSVVAGGLKPYCTEWMVVPIDDVANAEDPAVMQEFKKEIGQIIVNNKVPGSPTDGNTSVDVADMFGTTKTVKFTIPNKVSLQIEARLATPESTGVLDLSRLDDIKDAMVAYVNNLAIGIDVSYSRLAAPLFADKGFDVNSFKIKAKDDAEWLENSNYTIGERQYAHIELADIDLGL